MSSDNQIAFSEVDRKLLKILLSPDGNRVSSKILAKKLGIPLTTAQRRRRRLEKEFLTVTYSLTLEKFGWHRVEFLISTEKGKTLSIAKQLLARDEVVYVRRSIGQLTIDLRVETIVKDNAEILNMMELIRAIPGVKDAVWSEVVQDLGSKTSIPNQIIDKL